MLGHNRQLLWLPPVMSETEHTPFYLSELRNALAKTWEDVMADVRLESCYPDPRLTTQTVCDTIMCAVKSILVSLARDFNDRALVSHLPVELLAAAFERLEVQDRMNASLVSRKWHKTIYSYPAVWRRLSCGASERAALALTRMLDLSAQASIELDVVLSEQTESVLIPLLTENLHRCTRLVLRLGSVDFASWPRIESVRPLLDTVSTPHLQTFILEDFGNLLGLEAFKGVRLFGGDALRLDSVILKVMSLQILTALDLPAFANVSVVTTQQSQWTSPANIGTVLSTFPSLRYLRVIIESWPPNAPEATVQLPSSLKSLVLSSTSGADFAAFKILQHLNFHQILRISVECFDRAVEVSDEDLLMVFDGWSRQEQLRTARISWPSSLQSLNDGAAISFCDQEIETCLPASYTGPIPSRTVGERTIFDLRQRLPESLFDNVTTLYLHELVFDSDSLPYAPPVFPQVEDLRISLMNHFHHLHNLGISPFLGLTPPESTRALRFPVLQRLMFSTDFDQTANSDFHGRQTVTPLMVMRFVSRHLCCHDGCLRTLEFVGVELLVGTAEEFGELLRLAHDVRWDEGFTAWAANLDAFRAHSET